MKAKEKRFLHFLEGSDKHFVIPVYQRNYDWKKEHCKQLFDDLISIVKNNFCSHFLGSVVSIYHDNGEDREYLIIDGQQRITTLSILLLSIYKILDQELLEADINKEQLKDEYLVNKYSKDDKKIRLKPVKNDKNAFSKLFKNDDEHILDSNITENYKYFFERILQNEVSVDDLFSAIKQLIIVEIELIKNEDDPQLIFESLNSTGLDLSEADKVRNFVLMKEDTQTQDHYYNEYWNKIEVNTHYNVSDFIRDYLTLKERNIPNKNKVYLNFKKYVNENVDNIEDLLKDLLKFSKYYKKIAFSEDEDEDVNRILKRINKLETLVSYPFLLEVFEDRKNDIINTNDLINILSIIESFVFRRLISDVPTNALNKIFMTLGREIKKFNDFKENYVEILKFILINKKSSQRFPTDEEFEKDIVSRDIYNFKSKNKIYLLSLLENYNNKEEVKIEELINKKELNIEHIMPQTLTPKWRDDLGKNWEKIYNRYLHTLGNITLTGYNSKMSNKTFLQKRDMKNGFKESRLLLNKYLQDISKWNEKSIKERAGRLKELALKIWEYPQTKYIAKKDEAKLFTLADDDYNFTGEKIESFSFLNGENQKVDTWRKFYEQTALILYDLDPVKLRSLVGDKDFNGDISDEKSKLRSHMKIAEKLYLEVNLSSESILSAMRILIEKMEIELSEVSFYIK